MTTDGRPTSCGRPRCGSRRGDDLHRLPRRHRHHQCPTSRPGSIPDEPALQTADLPATDASAVTADADLPITAVVVSTATINLDAYSHVDALAGLLAQDTAAADFNRDLDRLLAELAHLRRP